MFVRPALIAAVATLALAGCSGSDEPSTASDPTPTGNVSCEYVEGGGPAAKDVDLPPATAADAGEVSVTMQTSAGEIVLALDSAAAPCTVNSFVSLAEQGYFEDTPCHRLVDSGIHVLQCGDPTGTGTGGPGYTIPDELTGEESYPAGTLAMARTAAPNSGGSQFFLVYDETPLDPDYTVFGTIDEAGLQVVKDIAAEGTDDAYGPGDGMPVTPVTIESVTVN